MTIRELLKKLPYCIEELSLHSDACPRKFLVERDEFEYFYNLTVRKFIFDNSRLDVELADSVSKLWLYPLLEDLTHRGTVKIMHGGNIDIIRKDQLLDGLKVLPSAEIIKIIYSEPGDYIILVCNKE